MKKKIQRISLGVLIGLMALTAVIWLLSRTLGNVNYYPLFAGKPIQYWRQQLDGPDAQASNAAIVTISSQIAPPLVETMLHDTNDSRIKLALVKMLNGLPGIFIDYADATARRVAAAEELGEFGPAAKSSIPELTELLKQTNANLQIAAMSALGNIHSEPDSVVPLLIPYLSDDTLDVPAAKALGEFGSMARAAVPKLLPLLKAKDDDDQSAAQQALLKIDPDAAAKAGVQATKLEGVREK